MSPHGKHQIIVWKQSRLVVVILMVIKFSIPLNFV